MLDSDIALEIVENLMTFYQEEDVIFDRCEYTNSTLTYFFIDDCYRYMYRTLGDLGEACGLTCSMTYTKDGMKEASITIYDSRLNQTLERDFSFAGVWKIRRSAEFLKEKGVNGNYATGGEGILGCVSSRFEAKFVNGKWSCRNFSYKEELFLPESVTNLLTKVLEKAKMFVSFWDGHSLEENL